MNLTVKGLYDLTHTAACDYLAQFVYPWEALDGIKDFIRELGATLSDAEYDRPEADVWIAKSAKVYPNTYIAGPCIIGCRTEVRPGAFIRGSVLVGEDCVVGNSTELKNCIIFDRAEVPHFNYVGDSVLGYRAHMGAGAVTSNLKSDRTSVVVRDGQTEIDTGRRKLGAMLGDYAEVGCNSVLNPGTVVGRYTRIYPTSCVRGAVPEKCIYKDPAHIVPQK